MKRFFLMFAVLAIIGSAFGAGQCPVPGYSVGNDQTVTVQVDGPVISKCYEPTGLQINHDQVVALYQSTGVALWADHKVIVSGLDSEAGISILDGECNYLIAGKSTGTDATSILEFSYTGQAFSLVISSSIQDEVSVTWNQLPAPHAVNPTLCLATSIDAPAEIETEWRSFNLSGIQDHKIYKAPLQPGRYWSRGRVIEVR